MRSTSKSVSSPIRYVGLSSFARGTEIAVFTMVRSASPFAWFVIDPWHYRWKLSSSMKRLLLIELARKSSLEPWNTMCPVKCTFFPLISLRISSPISFAESAFDVLSSTPVTILRRLEPPSNGFLIDRKLWSVSVLMASFCVLSVVADICCSLVAYVLPVKFLIVSFTSALTAARVRLPDTLRLCIRTCSITRSGDRPAQNLWLLLMTCDVHVWNVHTAVGVFHLSWAFSGEGYILT